MQASNYSVAIILINYNSSQHTLACVQSILNKTPKDFPYQIIVIDNDSALEDFEKLAPLKEIKHLQLVRSHLNLGFSGGNMFALQFVEASYYLFINNDCLLIDDCITTLYQFMEENPAAGIASGQMYNEEMNAESNFEYLPTLAVKLIGSGILRWFNPSKYPSKRKKYQVPIQVGAVSGSCLFIRAEALYKVGGFDTNYFLYSEEEDLAFNIQKKGYRVYFIPKARYQHFIGKSTNHAPYKMIREFYISYLYYQRKNYGLFQKTIIQTLLFFKNLKRGFTKGSIYFRLAFFILSGANFRYSLRFEQNIRKIEKDKKVKH